MKIALGTLLGRSWLFLASLGRLLASLGVSLACRELFWSDFGAILEPFWDDFGRIFRNVGRVIFFTCFSFGFSCAGALKVVFFALAATRAPKQSDRENTRFFMLF